MDKLEISFSQVMMSVLLNGCGMVGWFLPRCAIIFSTKVISSNLVELIPKVKSLDGSEYSFMSEMKCATTSEPSSL